MPGRRPNACFSKQPDRQVTAGRRGFLAMVGGSALAVAGLTSGQSFAWFRSLNAFGSRDGKGPQDLPVNKTARSAGVQQAATDPAWQLTIEWSSGSRAFSLIELATIRQSRSALPISCVEGWSVGAAWRGVRMKDLLAAAGAPTGRPVRVTSLEPHGPYRVMRLEREFVASDLTLVALELNGSPLTLDHGFPARIIAPSRPGVLQTKWLSRIEVLP